MNNRSAWAVAVSWVVYACATGVSGPVNALLSWKAFAPLSRINYSAYLYHILVMIIIIQNSRGTNYFSDYFQAVFYLGLLVLGYGVAFLASLFFESPFVALEKIVGPAVGKLFK